MSLDVRPNDLHYVDVDKAEVDRRIFSDPAVFDLEMEVIFGRAWQFMCHETQIPKPGDFFEAPMGRDNVLVVRQRDGSIKGLLNTCTHRGNAVCRAEEGNTKNFMCTYHGWTFDLAGQLIGVPGFENLYHGELDKNALGLREVAQLDTYKGFVFATLDPSAPPLFDYLGATGRLGIDLIAEQGDMQIVPGVQKYVIDCNWKFPTDNVFDYYHGQITHLSAMNTEVTRLGPRPDQKEKDTGGAKTPDGEDLPLSYVQNEHIVLLGEYGHAAAGPVARDDGAAGAQPWRQDPKVVAALGPVGIRVGGHRHIFPNSWCSASTTQISLRVPRAPEKTEIWWFSFVDKNLSPEQQERFIRNQVHHFGPAGFFEQEDGENWAQATMQTSGFISGRIPQLLKLDHGRGKVIKEHGLARIESNISEHAHLWTYQAWQLWLSGADWDTLRRGTQPPDTF
jgi:3-phenylpropionate/trans-cinnamate dioxygenase alpha subunit